MEKQNEYLTFMQVATRFPIFSEGSLRWHRSKNTKNFNSCIRKIGRKCVISLVDFEKWMNDLAENRSTLKT